MTAMMCSALIHSYIGRIASTLSSTPCDTRHALMPRPCLEARHIRDCLSSKPNNFRILGFESVVAVDWTHAIRSSRCANLVHILQHSPGGIDPAGLLSVHQRLANAYRQLIQRQVHITPLSLWRAGELVL